MCCEWYYVYVDDLPKELHCFKITELNDLLQKGAELSTVAPIKESQILGHWKHPEKEKYCIGCFLSECSQNIKEFITSTQVNKQWPKEQKLAIFNF